LTRRIVVLVGCIAAVLAVALPATANNKPTPGTRISMYGPPTGTFPANSPFYIEHGWACELTDRQCMSEQIGKGDFDLYLDGVLQPSKIDVDVVDGVISKLHLTTYASGLPAGTYTFTGVWTLDGVVSQTFTRTITFT
jgi:hypothetical protein